MHEVLPAWMPSCKHNIDAAQTAMNESLTHPSIAKKPAPVTEGNIIIPSNLYAYTPPTHLPMKNVHFTGRSWAIESIPTTCQTLHMAKPHHTNIPRTQIDQNSTGQKENIAPNDLF
ncbi:hypothetical protein J1614_006746 [Plenodomus biglobosus]|nr:hypothetical protein J1614_006746 [Plenodomus biglobosus]